MSQLLSITNILYILFLEDVLSCSERGKRLIRDTDKVNVVAKTGNRAKKRPLQIQELETTNHDSQSQRNEKKIINGETKTSPINNNSKQEALQIPLQLDGGVVKNESNVRNRNDPVSKTQKIDIEANLKENESPLPSKMLDICSNINAPEARSVTKYQPHQQRLIQQALQRGVNLMLMPQGFQRQIANRKCTRFDTKNDCMIWRVEFIFHVFSCKEGDHLEKQDGENEVHQTVLLTLERVLETNSVQKELTNMLTKHSSYSADPVKRDKLKHFFDKGLCALKDDTRILMKKIPCNSSKPKFTMFNFEQHKTVKDCLRNMTVIEFPTFEIIRKRDLRHFPLIIEELTDNHVFK